MSILRGCVLAAVVGVSCIRAEPPKILLDALKNEAEQRDRWAYTETRIRHDGDGKATERVLRVDPSKPYGEQYTPLTVDGKPPSEKVIKQFRERGERRARARHKRIEEAARKTPVSSETGPSFDFDKRKGYLDLEHASILEENETWVRYRIPLVGSGPGVRDLEKMILCVRLNKQRAQLEELSFELRDSIRVKVVAKIRSLKAVRSYTVVDPAFPPVLSSSGMEIDVSFAMLKRFHFSDTTTYSDFKRVKPYDERFKAEGGPVSVFDF